MAHIRGWYGLTDCHGSETKWTMDLPSDWDDMESDEQAKYLEDVALETLYNVLDCGAEVVDGDAP